MLAWLMLAGAVLFNVLGNVFMKNFSGAAEFTGIRDFFATSFVLALGCFGLNVLLYSRALKDISLAYAYPTLVSTSIVLISGLSVVLFQERLSARSIAGIALVLGGVVLLSRTT
jgi:small multidrug resistance pump